MLLPCHFLCVNVITLILTISLTITFTFTGYFSQIKKEARRATKKGADDNLYHPHPESVLNRLKMAFTGKSYSVSLMELTDRGPFYTFVKGFSQTFAVFIVLGRETEQAVLTGVGRGLNLSNF